MCIISCLVYIIGCLVYIICCLVDIIACLLDIIVALFCNLLLEQLNVPVVVIYPTAPEVAENARDVISPRHVNTQLQAR